MALDRGTLAKIDRRVFAELGHAATTQAVKIPLADAVWSTWRRYCEAVGLTMGEGVAGLIDHELQTVVDAASAEGAPVFAGQVEEELAARESRIAARERALEAAEERLGAWTERLHRREDELEVREQRTELVSKLAAGPRDVIPKVGRNERCPCQSGLKYKHCHGPTGACHHYYIIPPSRFGAGRRAWPYVILGALLVRGEVTGQITATGESTSMGGHSDRLGIDAVDAAVRLYRSRTTCSSVSTKARAMWAATAPGARRLGREVGGISMRKTFVLAFVALLLALGALAPATADTGVGKLRKAFNAGLSGGSAVLQHNPVWDFYFGGAFAEGRLQYYVDEQFICDQQVVGVWIRAVAEHRSDLEGATIEWRLDGDVLEAIRTPIKRVAQENPLTGSEISWWFAEGVPVLGTLDPGIYDLELDFDDGLGTAFTTFTAVHVDSAYCA